MKLHVEKKISYVGWSLCLCSCISNLVENICEQSLHFFIEDENVHRYYMIFEIC
jgi:hypothetical protein